MPPASPRSTKTGSAFARARAESPSSSGSFATTLSRQDRHQPHPLGHPRALRPTSTPIRMSAATARWLVVHNGIIENYSVLKSQLEADGFVFRSQTDTEVVAHLIAKHLNGDLVDAVRIASPT